MEKITVKDINLNYDIHGYGLPVVFINGLTMSLNGWADQIEDFASVYRVLRYDCRGQGHSDKPDMHHTHKIHAADLKALLDALSIKRAHIVGLSNGGMIAQHLALEHPESVGALVLVDTCSEIGPKLKLMLESWIKATELGGSSFRYDLSIPLIFSDDFIKKNIGNIIEMKKVHVQSNPPKAVINLAAGSLGHNVTARLGELHCPTLIVHGAHDILIPSEYAKIMGEKIPNSTLVIMDGCAHAPPLEEPEKFNRLVIEFLKQHDSLLECGD